MPRLGWRIPRSTHIQLAGQSHLAITRGKEVQFEEGVEKTQRRALFSNWQRASARGKLHVNRRPLALGPAPASVCHRQLLFVVPPLWFVIPPLLFVIPPLLFVIPPLLFVIPTLLFVIP